MNPKLTLSAAAMAAALAFCGCASQSDFNNGPYAEFGYTYDFPYSPIAPLGTDDASAVLALPATTGPGVFVVRNGVMNYNEPMAKVGGILPTVVETAATPSDFIPSPPPPHAP